VSSWGRKTHPTRSRSAWEAFDSVPALAPAGGVPTASCAFGDDLLEEIDSLLDDQDVLTGFWQAPGE
jgi:hypothetical protein